MKKYFTKFVFLLIVNLYSIAPCKAQYATGFGLRVGKFATGFDMKHFFDQYQTTGIEFFAGFTQEANSGYLAKLFFVKQKPLRDSRLQVPTKAIFGVGAHAGYFKDPYFTIKEGQAVYYPENSFSFGIDGTFGLEYNSRKLPFTVGVDATPYYTFFNPGPAWIDFGLTVRYIFRSGRRY